MFRSIRNKRNEISTDEAKELLRSSRRGILAVNGDDGYPYAIPINYLYDEDAHKIVFHGAKAGYKVDCLKVCDKVCFTVYGNERIQEESWAPFLQSTVMMSHVRRGQEKGNFAFGGSTIIYMTQKDKVFPDMDILINSVDGIETKVQIGSRIGKGKN